MTTRELTFYRRAASATLIAPLLVALAAALPASAEEPASGDSDLFVMVPANEPYLRIDRKTGRVSHCAEEADGWRCRLVADDRDAYEADIERLSREKADLEARIATLEAENRKLEDGANWIGPEDEKKLDEFMDFSDRAIRRFFGMVQDLEEDLGGPDKI